MRGKIFTNYYFCEANTANKSGNQHNNAINENLNWGGIYGLLQLATTNSGSRPEIQDGPGGGRGKRGKRRRRRTQHHRSRTLLHADDELLSRQFSAERWHRRKNETNRCQEEKRQFKPTIKGSIITQSARILGKRTEVNRMTRILTGVRSTKGTTGIPNLSSESRQYDACKAL